MVFEISSSVSKGVHVSGEHLIRSAEENRSSRWFLSCTGVMEGLPTHCRPTVHSGDWESSSIEKQRHVEVGFESRIEGRFSGRRKAARWEFDLFCAALCNVLLLCHQGDGERGVEVMISERIKE